MYICDRKNFILNLYAHSFKNLSHVIGIQLGELGLEFLVIKSLLKQYIGIHEK